jgi:predicted nucleic acid-binding protein
MVIPDTSIWIEFFKNKRPFFDEISSLIEVNELIGLSFIFGELLQGAKSGTERAILQEFWRVLPKIEETDLFIRAGLESGLHKWMDKGIGLIDSAIILAARSSGARIWTLDKKLALVLADTETYSPISFAK